MSKAQVALRAQLAVLAVATVLVGSAQPASARREAFAAPRDLREISYYPADGGWTTMWTNWRADRYDTDLGRIASLGANTVRVVVQSELFGYPEPSAIYLDRLRQMIELADRHGLHVQLTLFDWHSADYADIAGSKTWARAMLGPYVGDPRIACVELRNEIDTTDSAALAWARTMIPFLQTFLERRTPVTISVGGSDPLPRLGALKTALAVARPDFYSLHYFGGGGETAYWTLLEAKRLVSPTPLWVGETGYPTTPAASGYADLAPTSSAQEAAQSHFLKTLQWASWKVGLPRIGIWTFSDFLPGAIPGESIPEAEYHLGLYRTDGSAKPAAAVVSTLFSRTKPRLDFNNGFEQAVADAAGHAFPAEWSGQVRAGGAIAQDKSVAHRGRASASLRSLDGRTTGGFFHITPIATAIPARATAEASVWVRVRARRADVRLALDWLNAAGRYYRTREVRLSRPGSGWTKLVIKASRPAAGRSVRLFLKVASSTGTVWFDDVRFSVRETKPS